MIFSNSIYYNTHVDHSRHQSMYYMHVMCILKSHWEHTSRPINVSVFEMSEEGLLLFYAFVKSAKHNMIAWVLLMGKEYEIGYTKHSCNPTIIPEISSLSTGWT